MDLIKGYRTKIEIELEDICMDVLRILDEQLIPTSKNTDGKVFFLKINFSSSKNTPKKVVTLETD